MFAKTYLLTVLQDDYKSQVSMLKKQLKDASEQAGKGDNKLQSVTANLRTLQEDKARLQSAFGQKEAQLNALVRYGLRRGINSLLSSFLSEDVHSRHRPILRPRFHLQVTCMQV